MIQTITPNPRIPCKPGWCLAYVNEAYGVPKVHGSATAAWRASGTKHQDDDFPPGCWVPVWFALSNEPNGHVALRAPDGSVYSTSDNSTTPHHHPDLAELIGYYAHYGMRLTYLGWTEDVEGTPVIEAEEDMSLTPEQATQLAYIASPQFKADIFAGAAAVEREARAQFFRDLLNTDVPWYGFDGRVPESGRTTTNPATDLGWADSRAAGLVAEIRDLKAKAE
jgi:hypothetical protein